MRGVSVCGWWWGVSFSNNHSNQVFVYIFPTLIFQGPFMAISFFKLQNVYYNNTCDILKSLVYHVQNF